MAEQTSTDPETGVARSRGRTLIIETHEARREIALTPARLRLIAGAAVVGVGWTLTATAGFLITTFATPGTNSGGSLLEDAYVARIAALEATRDELSDTSEDRAARLDRALVRIVEQQGQIEAQNRRQDELGMELAEMRDKLARTVADRDRAQQKADRLGARMASLRSELGGGADAAEGLADVVAAVSEALDTAVEARDSHAAELDRLHNELATQELRIQINAERQERFVGQLEDAIEVSFRPLEEMFSNSGLDVDSLVAGVRSTYTGVGGATGALVPASLDSTGDAARMGERYGALMDGMDRMNMMRIAAAKIPYTMPVRSAHRFTSGFGYRRDPLKGGSRLHAGIDLASSRGTPIVATADGTVVHAGWQSGYGKTVRIRHAYGFETLFGHLNKIDVSVGDRVARGDHIGDMGTTGRSTGVHLHYEVHLGGEPVNPLTYIKAARDVF